MSLHPDHLMAKYNGENTSQRLEDDFLFALFQSTSVHMRNWVEGAVNMILEDVGDLIDIEQTEFWKSLALPNADMNTVHAFFSYCLWQYPSIQEAIQQKQHHSPLALSYFLKQVTPMLFENFFDGKHDGHNADSFVRDFRANYIMTVGFTHTHHSKVPLDRG